MNMCAQSSDWAGTRVSVTGASAEYTLPLAPGGSKGLLGVLVKVPAGEPDAVRARSSGTATAADILIAPGEERVLPHRLKTIVLLALSGTINVDLLAIYR